MNKRYYDFNTYLRSIFGCRVQKITLDAGLSCPNRDGTISRKGCIFCNPRGSGTGAYVKGLSITDQLVDGKTRLSKRYKAKKFIAYFQSFTNTYAPLDRLKSLYEEAMAIDDVVGLSIGTRPDCVDEPILKLLQGYTKNYLVWIEYGLQSVHDSSLSIINRGHDFKCFQQAVDATKNRGIKVCAHVILGLPDEKRSHMLETAKAVAKMEIDGIKIHLLYVVKGTELEKLYQQGRYKCLEQEEYVDLVCDFLELIPHNMVIQRLTGDPHPEELVAPAWSLRKTETLALITKTLEKRDSWQGRSEVRGQRAERRERRAVARCSFLVKTPNPEPLNPEPVNPEPVNGYERINKHMERTLSIIKPDGVARGIIGEVIKRFEGNNLKIVAMKMIYMTKAQAQGFYAVHKERPFFDSLTDFMSSGPIVVLILKGEKAIAKYRELMGATDYKEAAEGTIRRDFATDIEKNIVHGSDSPESADFEIGYFFNSFEIIR